MRNSLPLLSRSPAVATTPPQAGPPIPSIRLISATPSASGLSSEASTSFNKSLEESWASAPVPLAPKQDIEPRKRLVPKKSKLSILTMGRDKEKDRGKDLSDVVRRVGGDSISARGGFEIFVDPTIDPDIGEIVMVKKKKSRAALDGMAWGALDEVTNIPKVAPKQAAPLLKVKNEEKEKWWTLGRGRKDSKDKTKENKENKMISNPVEYIYEPPRSKTPESFKVLQEARGRFNSLDSGVLLNGPSHTGSSQGSVRGTQTLQFSEPAHEDPSSVTYSRAGTPTAGGLLAVPPSNPGSNTNQGSIALRAMRSVRSLARIGSWAQLKSMPPPDENSVPATVKEKKKSIKEKPTKEKGDKKKEKTKGGDTEEKGGEKKKKKSTKQEKEKAQTVRLSSSSFEVGGLTASPEATKTLGPKKHNILGLGLPSTIRLPTVRAGSTASSNIAPATTRLSVDSATILGRNRAGSVLSTASSLRPLSTTSSDSRASSGSSTASVRWDEQGLETVKEQRKKDREVKRQNEETSDRRASKESRRSSEGRRRMPLSSIFPSHPASEEPKRHSYPIVTIEEATSDGHGAPDDDEMHQEKPQQEQPVATPMKKARARPLSEQLLGRSRPRPMYEDDEGVLSILDAATNDLALLINTLDLQATPCTPDMTPLRPSPLPTEKVAGPLEYDGSPQKKRLVADSPLKKTLRSSMNSISSLRPYAQSRKSNTSKPPINTIIAQQIAPWPTLVQGLSPLKEALSSPTNNTTPSSTFRPTHKRTMTPAPEPEPEPIFQPLRPAKNRTVSGTLKASTSSLTAEKRVPLGDNDLRTPSSLTFGSRASSRAGSKSSVDEPSGGSLTPVFKRIHEQERKRSSLVPANYRGGRESQTSDLVDEFSLPIARETRKVLGMSGTMGGSDVSCYQGPEPDASDPDSDVPDELRFILATHSDRDSVAESLSFQDEQEDFAPKPSSVTTSPVDVAPPALQLPVFRASLIDDEENHCYLDEGTNTSDEDTKKSFDFTGELKKLNESGASDRRSFVEQLENAFRTPAKVDLRYDFGGHLRVDVPPVPHVPVEFGTSTETDSSGSGSALSDYLGSQLLDLEQPIMFNQTYTTEEFRDTQSHLDFNSGSQLVNVPEPSLLLEPNNLTDSTGAHDIVFEKKPSSNLLPSPAPSSQRPSDGELNRSFKFGGLPRSQSSTSLPKEDKPLTLSDIIPPLHARSLSNSTTMDEDDSVLNSIFAKITGLEQHPRVSSDVNASQVAQDKRRSIYKAMSRPSSGISFAGFDSFDEVRRGFEFSDERPAFYPPPAATRRVPHKRHESSFSIMSVSSYGRVIDAGRVDPFDYGLPSLRERPSSEDITCISMSTSIDDTFAFMENRPRRRVESDASSFYFKAPLSQQHGRPFTRGHRYRDSNMSVSSQAPPISLYNRSFGTHRRNDSSASSSSVALSYAMHGANSGMAAWARHRKEASVDSVTSDFSGMYLGRPGLGDKMFNNAADHGPLTSISASPPESAARPHFGHRSSFDSIMDDEQRSCLEDSLFEQTNNRSSMSSDSVFGDDNSHPLQGGLLPPNQFRPLSVLSINNSIHSPMKEDDTMISMLGGGHVRRRSIGSLIEASPCVRVEKRKHSAIHEVRMYKGPDNPYDSPNKARIVEKPSIASTSSYQFGGERMIKAQRGLLERQSLEDNCLSADGEELASAYCGVSVFTRPVPTTRSRSSTCTSSSGGDTPPLSSSDGSSISGGSQSSIDLSQIDIALSNATHPMSTIARNRVRARARGTGHRRRYSKSHISRSSVYETIEEEMSNASNSPAQSLLSKKSSPTTRQPVFIVDSDTVSILSKPEESTWDDDHGIVTLRKYYALRDEAENVVVESKRTWLDTPFSLFALQTFQAPGSPAGMQALLEHSVQSYHPLPSELRPRRVRTSSRPSPYPQSRVTKITISPDQTHPFNVDVQPSLATPVLRQININQNVVSTAPSLEVLKPFSPLSMDVEPKRENAYGLAPMARPRVASVARRTALGWSKRSTGKSSTDQKENVGQGVVMTPGDTLRLDRPRPRGRATPASQNRTLRPIRI